MLFTDIHKLFYFKEMLNINLIRNIQIKSRHMLNRHLDIFKV